MENDDPKHTAATYAVLALTERMYLDGVPLETILGALRLAHRAVETHLVVAILEAQRKGRKKEETDADDTK